MIPGLRPSVGMSTSCGIEGMPSAGNIKEIANCELRKLQERSDRLER
jgi:hypothetical protein